MHVYYSDSDVFWKDASLSRGSKAVQRRKYRVLEIV